METLSWWWSPIFSECQNGKCFVGYETYYGEESTHLCDEPPECQREDTVKIFASFSFIDMN